MKVEFYNELTNLTKSINSLTKEVNKMNLIKNNTEMDSFCALLKENDIKLDDFIEYIGILYSENSSNERINEAIVWLGKLYKFAYMCK